MAETILDGGSSTIENLVTGENRELRMDDSNKELRLHDGATVGGWRIPNRDANDARYQVKSTELNGIAEMGLPDAARGFLTRIGAGTYTVRSINGTVGEIDVLNPTGEGGDLVVSLPEIITADVTVTGLWTFTQAIAADISGQALGGGSGDFTGTFTGDVDVRGATLQLDNGQIQLDWLSQEIIDYIAERAVPAGVIKAWSGSVASIPSGYALCDGTNGTPDLRNRFIVGAGSTYAPGNTGGATSHNHGGNLTAGSAGSHSHSITVAAHVLTENELPSHHHATGLRNHPENSIAVYGRDSITPGTYSIDITSASSGSLDARTGPTGGGAGHSHGGSSSAAGAHTHSVPIGSESNLPPYYALAFIMKLPYA